MGYSIEDTNTSRHSLTRTLLVPWIDLIPYHFSPEFLQWLEKFKPDIIYSTLGSIRLVMTVQRISTLLSIPVIPHFMDDWLSTYSVQGKSITTLLQRTIIRNMTGRLLKKAPLGLSICDTMASEYSHRYKMRFDSFLNPVKITPSCPALMRRSTGNINPVRFIYIGGLHLSRYENLIEIAGVIRSLRKEGHSIEFHIFAPGKDVAQHGSSLTLENSVRVCGTLLPEDVQKVLCDYDVAVHVESFLRKHSLYTRLSLSTKIPQYLAAGLPILAYGPADVASCRYIDDNKCGITIGRQNVGALSKAIYELASNPELRFNLGQKSWEVAKERHDINKEQARFQKVLKEVASGSVA